MGQTDHILDSAIIIFRTHGFLGASISQLVAATGRSRSSLYNQFSDKDGLFTAALQHYVDTQFTCARPDSETNYDELPCLVTRSCNELADLSSAAAAALTTALEQQWDAMIGKAQGERAEARGTLALAARHGLVTLAAAGVPADVLREASAQLPK